MDTGLILGLDLGKFKTVSCACRGGGGAPAFHTVASTRAALLDLFERAAPGLVVIEACALAGWVSAEKNGGRRANHPNRSWPGLGQ